MLQLFHLVLHFDFMNYYFYYYFIITQFGAICKCELYGKGQISTTRLVQLYDVVAYFTHKYETHLFI